MKFLIGQVIELNEPSEDGLLRYKDGNPVYVYDSEFTYFALNQINSTPVDILIKYELVKGVLVTQICKIKKS